MLGHYLEAVRSKGPCIHSITNVVTVNDCANVLLACGAYPNMAEAEAEMEAMQTVAAGLYLNIGTLSDSQVAAMLRAGAAANRLGHPVVLDPVGAGASPYRNEACAKLLTELDVAVIRGNVSEIKGLCGIGNSSRGVDANPLDAITEENLAEAVAMAGGLARRHRCVVGISGALDVVTDGIQAYVVRNGHELMPKITGSGCMLSALTAAFVAASPAEPLAATLAAFCAMGIAGERAFAEYRPSRTGNAGGRTKLIDELFFMDGVTLDQEARYEAYEK